VVRKIPVRRQARFSFLQLEKHRVAASPVRRKQALLQLSSCSEQESAIASEANAIQTAPPATKANAKPLRISTSPPAFGDQLAPMNPHAPSLLPKAPGDLSVPRLAVRSQNDHGFLFVNNFVRGAIMPARPAFQVKIKLPGGDLLLPERPLDVPSGTYFIWPFHLDLGSAHLRYSTAQLFTRLVEKDQPAYVFFCIPGIRCELSFADHPGLVAHAMGGHIQRASGVLNVTDLPMNSDTTLSLQSPGTLTTRILVLTRQHAEDTWRVHFDGKEHLLITTRQFFANDNTITLQSDDDPIFKLSLFPAIKAKPIASSSLTIRQQTNTTTELFARLPAMQPHLVLTQIQQPRTVPPVQLGPPISWRPHGVAQAPAEATFADAAVWKLTLGKDQLHNLSNLFLQIDYTGDVGRLSDGTHLLDDNFFNGTPWTIGMRRFLERKQTGDLRLQILPLRADSPIFLEDRIRSALPTTGQVEQLRGVRIIPQYQLTLRTEP